MNYSMDVQPTSGSRISACRTQRIALPPLQTIGRGSVP